MSSRKAASKQISYKDESSSEEDSEELDLADKKIVKKGRRSQKKQQEEDENESSESEFELDKEKPKGKKGKGKARGGGKKKGKGKEKVIKRNPFDVLPFELFVEILSHLSPKDLLHFARTNKPYRAILLSKQRSEPIWKNSFEMVKLPALQAKDWSYPAYADLVFSVHCYECGRYSPTWIDPWLRTRLCKPCRQTTLVKLTDAFICSQKYHPCIRECLVGSHFTPGQVRFLRWGAFYVLPHRVEEMDARLKELQQEDEDDFSERTPLDRPVVQRNNWSRRGRYGRQHFQQQQQQQPQNQPRLTIQRPTRSVKKETSYREESDNEKDGDVKIGPKVKAFVKKRQK